MRISVYQINVSRDKHGVKFRDLSSWPEEYNGIPDASLYDRVFTGDVQASSLGDVFECFNSGDYPPDYYGHSLSVSDIIVVRNGDTVRKGAYIVRMVGFQPVPFVSGKHFDAVFWERQVDEGLTAEELSDLEIWMPGTAYIPMEVDNTNLTSSAMGFMSVRAAENEAWIRRTVSRVISDMNEENPSGEYVVDGIQTVNVKIMR